MCMTVLGSFRAVREPATGTSYFLAWLVFLTRSLLNAPSPPPPVLHNERSLAFSIAWAPLRTTLLERLRAVLPFGGLANKNFVLTGSTEGASGKLLVLDCFEEPRCSDELSIDISIEIALHTVHYTVGTSTYCTIPLM